MRNWLTILGLTALLTLTGCNTVRGFGQDVQRAGANLSDAASR